MNDNESFLESLITAVLMALFFLSLIALVVVIA